MKQRLRYGIVTAICAILLAIVTAALVTGLPATRNGNVVSGGRYAGGDGDVLISECEVGDVVRIPDRKISSGEKEYDAEKLVYFPDGSAYALDEITASMMGLYTVEYVATDDAGKLLSETATFYAYGKTYSTASPATTYYYGLHPYTESLGHQGLNVQLAAGDRFSYNKVIDLREIGSDTAIISFYYTPAQWGAVDVENWTMRLTDAYDPTNVVTINGIMSYEGQQNTATYIKAAGPGQQLTGYEAHNGYIRRGGYYGFPQLNSMYGTDSAGNHDPETVYNNKMRIYFDLAESQVLSDVNYARYNMVVDLDDSMFFTELWKGFTTGEVFFSIEGGNYTGGSWGLVIDSIAGDTLADDTTALRDDLDPIITPDIDEFVYGDVLTLPKAEVGAPYKIFGATAADQYSGEIPVTACVYERYGTGMQSECNVVGGVFTPTHAGTYSIVYTATDYSGNTAVLPIEIECLDHVDPLEVTVRDDDNKQTAGYVGTYITVAEADLSGGNAGNAAWEVSVACGDVTAAVENGRFKPLSAGTYTVTYTATDYIGRKATASYEVAVTLSPAPVFENDVYLPMFVVDGYEYLLPELIGYDYNAGGAAVPCKITVTDDAGENVVGENRKFVFTINPASGTKEITVKYEASNGSSENVTGVKTYHVIGINATQELAGERYLDMGKFFVTQDFGSGNHTTVTAEDDKVTIASEAGYDASAMYANPIPIRRGINNTAMSIVFSIPADATYDYVQFMLADNTMVSYDNSEGGSRIVAFTLSKNAQGIAELAVNDHDPISTGQAFVGGSFNLRFDGRRVTANSNTYLTVNDYIESEIPYEGFASNTAYLMISVGSSDGQASQLNITEINGGMFNNQINDFGFPQITIQGEKRGVADFGGTFAVYPAISTDLFTPYLATYVKVTDPSGEVVTSVDGVRLNYVPADRIYEISAEMYGSYGVEYRSDADKDGMNTGSLSYRVSVEDKVAPTITLSRDNVTSAKVGDVVVVATATASDNLSAAEDIIIKTYIQWPDGIMQELAGNSFKADFAGTYNIKYMAIDKAGNITVLDSVITVTE